MRGGARIAVGAGWDLGNGPKIDVDLGVALFANSGDSDLGMVYYGNKTAPGLSYLEDNRTGEGGGDDETALIDLATIPHNTEHIFITLNVYGPADKTFEDVVNLHCRLYYQDGGSSIIRFSIPAGQPLNGLVVAQLVRAGSVWCVETHGHYARGKTCVDLVAEMLALRGRPTKRPRLS